MKSNYAPLVLLTLFFCTYVIPVPLVAFTYLLTVLLYISSIYMVATGKREMDMAYTKWIVFFFLFCVLSLAWSVSIKDSTFVLTRMIKNIAFAYYIVLYVRSYRELSNVLLAFYIASVLFLVFLFSVMDVSMLGTDRFARTMEDEEFLEKYNSNYIAGQFVMAIYFGYFLFWKLLNVSKVYRYIHIGLTVVMLYVIFVSGSRMSLIILAIPLIVFNLGRKNVIKGLLYGMIAVVCLYFIVMKIPVFYDILGTRVEDAFNVLTNNEQGTEDVSRLYLIEIGWNKFWENPIWGYGINCFRVFSNQSYWFSGRNYYAHNNYIELMVDVGLIGLFIYYYFAHWYLYQKYKLIKDKEIKKVLLVLLLVIIISDIAWVAYYGFISQLLLCVTFAVAKIGRLNDVKAKSEILKRKNFVQKTVWY